MDKADDLFTQEQHDYVAKIEDAYLRDELLYQIRLRDLVRAERDLIQRRCDSLTDQVVELKQEK